MSAPETIARSTAAAPVAPLNSDDGRRLLADHLAGRKEKDVAASAAAWATQARSANEALVWKLGGHLIAPTLTELLATAMQLAARLRDNPPTEQRPRYREWLQEAQSLLAHWPPTDVVGWEALLVTGSTRENRLLRACIARALGDALTAANVPKTISAPLVPLVRADSALVSEVSLPPNPAAPSALADYVFAADELAIWQSLGTLCGRIRAALNELGQLQAQFGAAPTDEESRLVRDIPRGLTELEKLVALGNSGWPISRSEVTRLKVRLADLLKKLPTARCRLQFDPTMLAEWVAALSTAESVKRELQATAPDPQAMSVAADSIPAADEPAVAMKPAKAVDEPVHLQLRHLIEALSADGDVRAQQFAARLQPLAAASPVEADQGDSRKLLACLIYLDELAVQEQALTPWVGRARGTIQGIIDRDLRYKILGPQLVGRSLAEVARLVVAVGYVATQRVQPGQIGKVQQPGYAMVKNGQVQEVICQAKVLVARAPNKD